MAILSPSLKADGACTVGRLRLPGLLSELPNGLNPPCGHLEEFGEVKQRFFVWQLYVNLAGHVVDFDFGFRRSKRPRAMIDVAAVQKPLRVEAAQLQY